jgi:hypothetical protein
MVQFRTLRLPWLLGQTGVPAFPFRGNRLPNSRVIRGTGPTPPSAASFGWKVYLFGGRTTPTGKDLILFISGSSKDFGFRCI